MNSKGYSFQNCIFKVEILTYDIYAVHHLYLISSSNIYGENKSAKCSPSFGHHNYSKRPRSCRDEHDIVALFVNIHYGMSFTRKETENR